MNSSRRYFLKVAGLSTFALAAGAARAEAAKASYEAYPEGQKAKRWAMVIDTRRIQTVEDMRPIVEACHKVHNVPTIPGKHEVKWIWDDTFEHAFANDPSPMLPENIENRRFFLLCNHCTNPSCVRVCPAGATYKTEGGLVAIDYHRCVGCRFCMAACPYQVRNRNEKTGAVDKCRFCNVSNYTSGTEMCSCVTACPTGARIFGDLDDPDCELVKEIAATHAAPIAGDLTKSKVYYVR